MSGSRWPHPFPTLRSYLPAEMRLLNGIGGFVGGLLLLLFTFSILLGGNWHLGFADDRILTGIFLVFVPAAIGILSPLWFWIGRPLWVRFNRPGYHVTYRFERARFLLGLFGSLVGSWIILRVSATSHLAEQSLAPFGLALALGFPLWYWVIRPIGYQQIEERLPGSPSESRLKVFVIRSVPVISFLFLSSLAVTAFISMPIVAVGQQTTADGLAVTVTETQTVSGVTEVDSDEEFGQHSAGLLLFHISMENRGTAPKRIPGSSVTEIGFIAPYCQAQTFGEPSNNCNRAYVHGDFSAGDSIHTNFDDQQELRGGKLNPGEGVDGWLVFRIESAPTPSDSKGMIIVEDVGRWTLERG